MAVYSVYLKNDDYRTTGCDDVLCPGFVQVSKDITVGVRFTPSSVYNGTQHYVILTVYRDPVSKDWWLLYGDDNQKVGYWPKAIFPSTFADHVDIVQWGGYMYIVTVLNLGLRWGVAINQLLKVNIDLQVSKSEYRFASYIGGMKLFDVRGMTYIPITSRTPLAIIQTSPCYKCQVDGEVPGEDYAIFFRGPGGNNS
ncbi:protein neprosin-like [Tasmannia lanceolata]|uniref:protein neprosin-like n=1 Tax=Tasmannia lanceolata TaxID=3420 RepID=UPI0040631B58